jgi:hypothetical protein
VLDQIQQSLARILDTVPELEPTPPPLPQRPSLAELPQRLESLDACAARAGQHTAEADAALQAAAQTLTAWRQRLEQSRSAKE